MEYITRSKGILIDDIYKKVLHKKTKIYIYVWEYSYRKFGKFFLPFPFGKFCKIQSSVEQIEQSSSNSNSDSEGKFEEPMYCGLNLSHQNSCENVSWTWPKIYRAWNIYILENITFQYTVVGIMYHAAFKIETIKDAVLFMYTYRMGQKIIVDEYEFKRILQFRWYSSVQLNFWYTAGRIYR